MDNKSRNNFCIYTAPQHSAYKSDKGLKKSSVPHLHLLKQCGLLDIRFFFMREVNTSTVSNSCRARQNQVSFFQNKRDFMHLMNSVGSFFGWFAGAAYMFIFQV